MSLTVVYAREAPPAGYGKSVMLIGPSPRDADVQSWRPEAIQWFEAMGYDGVLFVPEPRGERQADLGPDGYLDQVDWEEAMFNMADVIMCWLPRDIEKMPGFTTNVEIGMWLDSGKVVFGGPQGAYKNRYIEHHAAKRRVPVAHSLHETVANALKLLGDGAWRQDGEREVPLLVWRTSQFQEWYAHQKAEGHTLEHAKLVWTLRHGPDGQQVFFWVLHAEMLIGGENRRKTNEVVIGRPHISVVVLYRRAERLDESLVVLVEEYRTPGGRVQMPPGGSSKTSEDPLTIAVDEVHEETGLLIDASRFVPHGSRHMVGTTLAQLAYVFSVEITDDELALLLQDEADDVPHGVEEDTERTYVRVPTLGQIRLERAADWSVLGMLFEVLA